MGVSGNGVRLKVGGANGRWAIGRNEGKSGGTILHFGGRVPENLMKLRSPLIVNNSKSSGVWLSW